MITKLHITHVVVYVQILSKLPVVFAEIRPPKPKKIKSNSCTFSVRRSVWFGFGFGAYVKALIGFKAFYFFSSVSVRFRCVCEMALKQKIQKRFRLKLYVALLSISNL